MLARAASRQKEFAVRASLGASRWRVVRQLLTEGILLAVAGGTLGTLLAVWGVDVLIAALHRNNLQVPLLDGVHVDTGVLGFTLGLSLLTGIIFSLVPAFGASRLDTNETLKDGSRTVAGGRTNLRRFLVIAEVALSVVLLAGAGLMIKSFLLLEQVNPGLQPENVLTMDVSLLGGKYAQAVLRDALFSQVVGRIRALPGVRAAAFVADLPFGGGEDVSSFQIEGVPDRRAGETREAQMNLVTPDYFRAMGIPLRSGRNLTAGDGRGVPGAVIINEAMARRFWPGESAVGRRITFSGDRKNWRSIAGVVADVPDQGLQSEPQPLVYLPYQQDANLWPGTTLVVKSDRDPAQIAKTVREAIRQVDRDLPISRVQTMEQVLSASLVQPRLSTFLLGIFGALALLLAAVGLYGVVSYSVEQRTHEIGIRLALGARPGDVRKMVLGQGLGLALAGVALGVAGALGLTRVLSGFLFHTAPADATTFASVVVALLAIAAAASYLPARRAMRVDPIVALHYE